MPSEPSSVRSKQVLVAALADEFVESGGEKVEAGVVGEAESEFLPEKAAAGDFFHHGAWPRETVTLSTFPGSFPSPFGKRSISGVPLYHAFGPTCLVPCQSPSAM